MLRGVGAARQSLPFDVSKALDVLGQTGAVQLPDGTPVGWANLIVIGTFFVMREVELAFAKVAHVKIGLAEQKFTLLLQEGSSGDRLRKIVVLPLQRR